MEVTATYHTVNANLLQVNCYKSTFSVQIWLCYLSVRTNRNCGSKCDPLQKEQAKEMSNTAREELTRYKASQQQALQTAQVQLHLFLRQCMLGVLPTTKRGPDTTCAAVMTRRSCSSLRPSMQQCPAACTLSAPSASSC